MAMELKLEELSCQREAIGAVLRLFEGQPLRVDARFKYYAPVKDYSAFKTRAKGAMHA